MTAIEMVRVGKRIAEPRDYEIGKRIRALRLERNVTQTELGNLVGVTFQQIQKYEKGQNRVSAGRLQKFAQVLRVPITFFYDGMSSTDAEADSIDNGLGFLETAGAVRLVRAFSRLKDGATRTSLILLLEGIADLDNRPLAQ